MDAIIMAAGKGTRLMPLTEDKPKCMVKILGKPIIHWTLDSIDKLNIDNIYIISNYREGILKSYIKYNIDRDITFIHQKKLSGTADAIYLAKDYIDNGFLVLSGDTIFSDTSLYRLRQLCNSLIYTKKEERLYEFGTMDMYGNRILKINEKSTEPTSNLVNCSGYHFNNNVFDYIPKTIVDNRFGERIITNTINLMLEDCVDFTGIYMNELNEISRPEDIEVVEERLR